MSDFKELFMVKNLDQEIKNHYKFLDNCDYGRVNVEVNEIKKSTKRFIDRC